MAISALVAGQDTIQLPYIYVLEEPNYPRVMGFDFKDGDKPGTYRYEVYLPGGAEEFGIALFHPDDYRFVGFIDTIWNVKKGMLTKEVSAEHLLNLEHTSLRFLQKRPGRKTLLKR